MRSRRHVLLGVSAAVALVAAACTTASTPGWTYAPPPSEAAAASAEPSAGTSEAPSSAPSVEPSAGASEAAGSGAPSGAVVKLAAQNIQFDQSALSATAGQPFQIQFDNRDAGVPHNVAVKDQSGQDVFKGDIVTGPTTTTYSVPALQAGTYTFYCQVHPNMTGTLTVK